MRAVAAEQRTDTVVTTFPCCTIISLVLSRLVPERVISVKKGRGTRGQVRRRVHHEARGSRSGGRGRRQQERRREESGGDRGRDRG